LSRAICGAVETLILTSDVGWKKLMNVLEPMLRQCLLGFLGPKTKCEIPNSNKIYQRAVKYWNNIFPSNGWKARYIFDTTILNPKMKTVVKLKKIAKMSD
jgi:hypothetical protein